MRTAISSRQPSSKSTRIYCFWSFFCFSILSSSCVAETDQTSQASKCTPPPVNQKCEFQGKSFLIGRFVTKKANTEFKFKAPPGVYCFKLKNGSQGYSKTSSAVVKLNDHPLWRENTFNQQFDKDLKTVELKVDNKLSVTIKSGRASEQFKKGNSKGAKPHALELWAGNYKKQTPTCQPSSNLYKVSPDGTKFENGGVKFVFSPKAVTQDTYLSVSCEQVPGAIAPKCSVEPHIEFSRGLTELRFPITTSNIPHYLTKNHIVGFKNGKQIPSGLSSDKKEIVVYPSSFSDITVNVLGWYGAVTDPPQGRFEPKTWNSSIPEYTRIPKSYTDSYGINIGVSTDNFITAYPGYKDPKDHSKGWKDAWSTTGKVSLCRKLKGETAYKEVDDGDYTQGKDKVEFGVKSIEPGQNLYFIAFREGKTKPGCTRWPSPPVYRTADLTITRIVEGLYVKVTVKPSTTISYDRYDKTLAFTFNEMKVNAASQDVELIRQLNANLFSILQPAYEEKLKANALTFALFNPHGVWNHKPYISDDTREPMLNFEADKGGTCKLYHFPVRGHKYEMYYDVWSNIHFGYVGRAAGWTGQELQDGAATWPFAGLNDGVDVVSAQIGIDLWDTYGLSLKQEQLSQKIINSVNAMIAAQETEEYKNQAGLNECTPPEPWKHIVPIENGK